MARPRIVTAAQMGLGFQNLFGELGPEHHLTGHYTAGPRDRDDAEALRLFREYHRQHAAKGWGGIGYHYGITRRGTLVCLRPTMLKGAHVGGWNSGNIGVVMHGRPGDKPTAAQRATLRWLIAYAHTRRMPRSHRTDLPLTRAKRRGHKDWPTHGSNQCPGDFHRAYLRGGR